MMFRAILAISFAVLLVAPAHASPMDDAVAQHESVPSRPLVVRPGTTQHYAGININLSSGTAFEVWNLPLGGGFGLTRNLEIGMNIDLLLYPWAIENLLATIRLYGRYLLIPKLLALEAALHVPTTQSGNLGMEITAPLRFRSGPVQVFAQGRLLYRGSQLLDQVLIGAAASGLYTVVDRFFVVGDVGFAVAPTRVNLGLGVDPTWNADWRLPIAVGAGYQLADDLFLKASFGFNDMASDRPFDQRFFQITLVQAINLQGDDPVQATDENSSEVIEDVTAVPALESIPDEGEGTESE